MSTEFEYSLEKITPADKTEMKLLAKNNGGNSNLTEEFLDHWYFRNPSGSNSLWKVVVNGNIEGFATTNNFRYVIDNKTALVAMPQNVLTSVNVRGKGMFNKLYFKTEADNLENGVDYFLTFTNAMSTPIFLSKFGYVRGKCPLVLFTFFNPLDLLSKTNYERVRGLDVVNYSSIYQPDNALEKTEKHIRWRYSKYAPDTLHILSVNGKDGQTGYAFLKVEKRKGIKFLLLMDMLVADKANIPFILETCFVYASRNFFLGVIFFETNPKPKKRLLRISFKERFNFLVKGKTQEETERLSKTDFNFFFGDLDIV